MLPPRSGDAEDPARLVAPAWSTCPRRPGCRPASSGAGFALLRGCGTPLAAPEAEWHGARHPGLGRGEPAVPSRPPWPALPLAVHLPRAARRGSLPAGRCAEVWGSAPASSFSHLPRDRCKHCLLRGGPRLAAAGVCRLRGSLNAPTGRDGPELGPLRRGPFRHSSGNYLRLLPPCVRKVEPLFLKRPTLAGAAGCGDRG